MVSDTVTGLTESEAAARRAAGGSNRSALPSSRSYGRIVRENVFTFINNVLFGLGIALVLLGRTSDALVSVGVILTNVIVSVVQEVRAKRTLDRIALLTRPTATVVRDGVERQVSPDEVVLGDVLVLRPGDQVVADGRVSERGSQGREGVMACLDESLLTGESDVVPKEPGDPVYSGSFCVSGSAVYVAEKVGAGSVANQLAAGARAFRRVLTPLQRQIGLAIRVILVIAVYFELLLAIDTVLAGIPLVESVKMSVVIAGLVPNGLFLAIAVAYAMGAVRMAGKGALVQQANAVESLSNVDVLCLDKTGTLTANRLRFHAVWPMSASLSLQPWEATLSPDVGAQGALSEDQFRRLLGDFAASTSAPNRTTEAIAAACPGRRLPVIAEVPFSSDRKWSTLVFDSEERRGLYVLGAPEMLRPSLRPEISPASPPGEPSSQARALQAMEAQAAAWADQGLRVLLMAEEGTGGPALPPAVASPGGRSAAEGMKETALPATLTPLGLVALADELRPDAHATLAAFARSGVALKIISGDNPSTVASLARQAGLQGDLKLISGPDLARLEPDGDHFSQVAEETTIFGRITPQQKEQLVRALRRRGHYVAMIGDGVNDVLSLKRADLGIAMQGGSQAARAVADITLLNDSFGALPYAVQEGQRIVNGMQDILKLFMTRVLYAALLIASLGVLGAFPFEPKQNSLLTLFTVGIPTIFLAAWARPGPVPKAGLVRGLMRFVLPAALTLAVTALGVFLVHISPVYPTLANLWPPATGPMGPVWARAGLSQTALTSYVVLCGLLLILFVEPPSEAWVGGDELSGDFRPVLLALALLAGYALVVAVAPLRRFFDLAPLPLASYALIAVAAGLWALLIRWVWRANLLERFLGADEW